MSTSRLRSDLPAGDDRPSTSRSAAIAGILGGLWGLALSAAALLSLVPGFAGAIAFSAPAALMSLLPLLLPIAALCLLVGGTRMLRQRGGRRALAVGASLAIVLQFSDVVLLRSMGHFVSGSRRICRPFR